jgi:hypothetical protein
LFPARSKSFATEFGIQDELIDEFDEQLWHSLADFATIYSENSVRFTFKDGTEILA